MPQTLSGFFCNQSDLPQSQYHNHAGYSNVSSACLCEWSRGISVYRINLQTLQSEATEFININV